MLGPHSTGGSPLSRSIIAQSSFASARRFGSGTASRKAPTSALVGFVLFSAIAAPLLDPGQPPPDRGQRLARRGLAFLPSPNDPDRPGDRIGDLVERFPLVLAEAAAVRTRSDEQGP